MNQRPLPRVLCVAHLASTDRFRVESVSLRFSNGEERVFERFHNDDGLDAVMVVPIYQERFVLVREYAVGVEAYTLGFPKGKMDAGESILETASRELREETGFAADDVQYLRTVSTAPGISSNRMHIVLASGLHTDHMPIVGDEPEPLEVIHWACTDAAALLEHPEFHESRSVAALLLWVQAYGKQ